MKYQVFLGLAPSNSNTNKDIVYNSRLDNTLLTQLDQKEENYLDQNEALGGHSSLHQNISIFSCNYCEFQYANRYDYD